jgi:uncharacterized protein (TIGR00730 family)
MSDSERSVRSVCVFCGASTGISAEYATAAAMLVSALVEHGARIVYGGGRAGVMGIVADTALALGGEVVGVIPTHLVARELAHPDLTELETTASISERKQRMAQRSDAFVALPGGLGTLEEITEVLSAAQLGLHAKPCALLNVNDYFEHLIEFINDAVGRGFVSQGARNLLIVESDPERLAGRLLTDAGGRFDRWSEDR